MKRIEPMVISYLRFSKASQAKGDSTRRQNSMAEDWCVQNDMRLTDRLDDKGISAFRGRNAKEGALSVLLELAREKRIPKGSYLLVEELDRISRQKPEKSLRLFLDIIDSGITVVWLMNGWEFRSGELDISKLQMMIMAFCLAHEESEKKSRRLAEAWKGKRAKIGEKVLTRRLPAWLKVVDGKIVVDQPKAEIVRQMFQMVIGGHGLTAVSKWVNANTHGSIGRRSYWNRSYVNRILHNEQCIGIYQPHILKFDEDGKHREAIGEPIKGYYPPIISEAVFYKAAGMMKSRRKTGGPTSKFVNLFSSLVFNAQDKSPMNVIDKGSGKQFISAAARDGRKGASEYISFPAITFEAAFLFRLCNINTEQTGKDNRTHRELSIITAKMDQLQARIAEMEKALEETGNVSAVIKMLAKMEGELKALETQQRELKATCAANDSMGDMSELITDHRRSMPDQKVKAWMALGIEDRLKLRHIVRTEVKRMDVKVTKDGLIRSAEIRLTWIDDSVENFTVKAHVKSPWVFTTIVDGEEITTTLEGYGDANAVTPDKRSEIRRLWNEGIGGAEIAKLTGVGISTVYRNKPAGWKPMVRIMVG